ncbi:pre-mRNA cleavage and polyadenylation factor (CPF) complex subunit [Puccinia graminis f. sp. tritici]|uniref:Pre-mRNA cleavage and polyadenylation factor (CPF) complex subunit n=1 Tax=Puccinia graminis f. sp. tritici TaxID=56615 RepID=A0A5B0LU17_PUCGR|nr:pre-mRNA cleavage and polyadenylation factor (CPF) complex subunit [Puccinia graminis f. sp. tritici]
MNADTHPTSGDGDAQAEEPTAKPSPSSPIASSSTPNKASPIDLRPRMGRKQGWDAWRPGPYGPPTPPSMEKRLAEESALEMAAMMGHGRQDGRARKIRPRRTVDVGGSMSRWTLVDHIVYISLLRIFFKKKHVLRPIGHSLLFF